LNVYFLKNNVISREFLHFKVMLMKILNNKDIETDEAEGLSFEEVADLIRRDPVTCMRHFDHRFRALLNVLLKPDAGLFSPFKLKDYFSRLEFQMRGSPHSHGLYWIEDAPIYQEGDWQSEKDCINFIDRFITCERNEDGPMQNCIGYQIHKHSHTCKKKQKRGQTCRFGFPKPPMEETRILLPLRHDTNEADKKEAQDLYLKIQDKLNTVGRGFKENIDYDDFLDSLGKL
jgi:hypothetical protein